MSVIQHNNVPSYTLLTGSTDQPPKDRIAKPQSKTVMSSTSLPTYAVPSLIGVYGRNDWGKGHLRNFVLLIY